MHAENGDMIATDSHRLIKIKNMHGFKEEYLINPKTFMVATGNYPDTSKLMDTTGHEAIALTKEQIKLWLQIFKSINQTLKVMKSDRHKLTVMQFSESENSVEVELRGHDVRMKLPGIVHKPSFESIAFSAEYMRDALEAHVKLNSDQATFLMQGPMRPIIIDNESNLETLILPVRVYN